MAPFLFLIIAEGLNGLMRQAVALQKSTPFKVGGSDPVLVSLLQFADDTLFIGEATTQNAFLLKGLLHIFELVSDLKVNFAKSSLVGISIDEVLSSRPAAILHCRLMGIPFMYLGLPVGGNPRRLAFWDPVIQRIKQRLSKWRCRNLSFGGRLCLVKSVLTALPLYYISIFRMPVGIINKCTKLMRDFLWGGVDGEKKLHGCVGRKYADLRKREVWG